jgi:hypothetical protein
MATEALATALGDEVSAEVAAAFALGYAAASGGGSKASVSDVLATPTPLELLADQVNRKNCQH